MKILHVASHLSRLGGGVATYVKELAAHQLASGGEVDIAGLADRYCAQDTGNCGAAVFCGRVVGPDSYGYSAELRRYLKTAVQGTDVCHSHGLWQYSGRLAGKLARRNSKPWIASIHGMLQRWCLRCSSAWKKRLFLPIEKVRLGHAHCLHVTSEQELLSVRACGLRNPVAIIPIGFDPTGYGRSVSNSEVYRHWPVLQGKKIVLFLGRVTPVKRVDMLLRAWAALSAESDEWMLVIAGPDWRGYGARMQLLADSCGVFSRTVFTGSVEGDLKRGLLGLSDVFVLPSECENFGITIAEALASGCPVITTTNTPWRELDDERCGWWINLEFPILKEQLAKAMRLTDEERLAMGSRGAELIRRRYSWPPLAQEMAAVYRWMMGAGGQPACVNILENSR